MVAKRFCNTGNDGWRDDATVPHANDVETRFLAFGLDSHQLSWTSVSGETAN